MEPLACGTFSPFSNWASGIMSTACAHSCSEKQHYHRHCGCAFHSIDKRFTGSPSCSPSCTAKVSSGSGSRSGMYRSISMQNLGEKCNHHALNALSEDAPVSTFGFSPNGSDLEFACTDSSLSQEETKMGTEYTPSVETLTLVEELASFIHRVKDEHTAPTSQRDDEESTCNDGGICTNDDSCSVFNISYIFSSEARPAIMNGSCSIQLSTSLIAGARSFPDPQLVGVLPPAGSLVGDFPTVLLSCSADIDHLLPRRVSLLEKRSIEAKPPQKAKRHVSHRRMGSYGR